MKTKNMTTTFINETKCNDWYPETRSLLRSLKAEGFVINKIDNGENVTRCNAETTEETMLREATATEECRIYCTSTDGEKVWLYLVLGNETGYLVCDYICHPILDKVTDAEYEKWDGKPQPQIGEADWMARARSKA